MHLQELLNRIPVLEMIGNQNPDVSEIIFDSRKAVADSLYISIKGTVSDGHSFIDSSIEKATPEEKHKVSYYSILSKIWIECLFQFINFTITFMVYPSITFKGGLNISPKASWNIFVYNLSYSLGDFSGRSLSRIR